MPLVYALGSNGAGQLGVGHLDDIARAEKCVFMSKPGVSNGSGSRMDEEDEVKKIVAGGNHTLVLMESGRVFAAGRNVDGRLGLSCERRQEDARVFEEIDFSELEEADGYSGGNDWKVTDIAATWESSIFVFNHRVVFACGSGAKGELGLGPDIQLADTLKKVFKVEESGLHIMAVAACMAHVVMIVSDGSVLGWGGCRKGQLGQGVRQEKLLWTPRRLGYGISFNPERVVVGREYTVLIRSGEQPVVWGDTKFFKLDDLGVLGQNEVLVSGWSALHSYSSAPTSLVKSIGRNDRGQLASNKLPPLRTLAAGSEHCVGITSTDGVIAWGWGEHGNCGEPIGDEGNEVDHWNQIPVPHLEDGIVVRDVAAGCATTFIICGRDG